MTIKEQIIKTVESLVVRGEATRKAHRAISAAADSSHGVLGVADCLLWSNDLTGEGFNTVLAAVVWLSGEGRNDW